MPITNNTIKRQLKRIDPADHRVRLSKGTRLSFGTW
jgi:hypothetical protein